MFQIPSSNTAPKSAIAHWPNLITVPETEPSPDFGNVSCLACLIAFETSPATVYVASEFSNIVIYTFTFEHNMYYSRTS